MSIIEKAAQRLEQLRHAGVEIETGVAPSVDAVANIDKPPSFDGNANDASLREEHGSSTALRDMGHHVSARSVRSVETNRNEVSRKVELDLARLAAMGVMTPDTPRSQIADEYRVIKRPLISNAMGKGAVPIENGNLIMVTSSLPGEGKSFSAVNLAMSIAMELDNTVLLVDADVARPSVLNFLGLPPAKGLLDVLTDDRMDLSQALLRTNIEKLAVLPSGTPHPRATELLASDAMIQLLEDIAKRYSDRIVIFDSPPLLVTTEARVLATHMGQIVMVVESDKTSHASVKHALATIESCPVRLIMLNKNRQTSNGSYYGQYGYGGYGHAE